MLNAKGSISPCIGDFDSAEAVTFTYGGAAEGGIPKLIIDGK